MLLNRIFESIFLRLAFNCGFSWHGSGFRKSHHFCLTFYASTRSLGAPPGPNFKLEALRASWLRPSRPSGAQAGMSGPLKVRPATYTMLTIFTILDHFRPFLTIFDHFGTFWIILDQFRLFWQFLAIFTISGNFDHFWPFSKCLPFWTIWDDFGPKVVKKCSGNVRECQKMLWNC